MVQSEQHVIYRMMPGGGTIFFSFIFLNQTYVFGAQNKLLAMMDLKDIDLSLREREGFARLGRA